MTKQAIPDYPGPLPKKPPEPPKYLVQVNDDGKHALVQVKGTPPAIRSQGLADPNVPILAKLSEAIPERDYTSPAHYYPPRKEYVIPGSKNVTKAKDSRRDTKLSYTSQSGQVVTYSDPPAAVPKFPAIPRPFVPKSAASLADVPMMHTRAASGKILGGPTRRYVNADHIPAGGGSGRTMSAGTSAMARGGALVVGHPTVDVGPNNPIKELSAVWCACWDDEAGATYYYNRETGEATWIIPDDVK